MGARCSRVVPVSCAALLLVVLAPTPGRGGAVRISATGSVPANGPVGHPAGPALGHPAGPAVAAAAGPAADSGGADGAVARLERARSRLNSVNARLAALEPYVSKDADGRQRLDAARAAAAGTDPYLLALARELVDYQNNLRTQPATRRLAGVTPPRLPLTRYPLVQQLFLDADTVAVARADAAFRDPGRTHRAALDVRTVHPCGDTAHPVPDFTPPEVDQGPYPDPAGHLQRQGFHHTRGYACGTDEPTCSRDFTRGRVYVSPYGTCAAPAYRDQAHLRSRPGIFWLQLGEPNPEIRDYVWPYWNWGAYVSWWHAHF